MVFRPERNAAFEWTEFDHVHAAVVKPGKYAFVVVLMKVFDADEWQMRLK